MKNNLFNSDSYYPIDRDCLGKILVRTFARYIGNCPDSDISDDIFYKGKNQFPGDTLIYWQHKKLSCEIKTSGKLSNHFGDHYAFAKWRCSAQSGKLKLPFDRLFCIGLPAKGYGLCAPPNSPKALKSCEFFVLPYLEIPGSNQFQPYLRTLHKQSYFKYYAHGSDYNACCNLWHQMWN